MQKDRTLIRIIFIRTNGCKLRIQVSTVIHENQSDCNVLLIVMHNIDIKMLGRKSVIHLDTSILFLDVIERFFSQMNRNASTLPLIT